MSPDASTPDAVNKDEARTGPMGQRFLAGTDTLAMRLWDHQQPGEAEPPVARDYETVGYVVSGRVELTVGTSVLNLGPGDSWAVPRGAEHSYRVVEVLTAVEATSPPAQAQI
jgi:quercetin dioxygenase-like cupin family protein